MHHAGKPARRRVSPVQSRVAERLPGVLLRPSSQVARNDSAKAVQPSRGHRHRPVFRHIPPVPRAPRRTGCPPTGSAGGRSIPDRRARRPGAWGGGRLRSSESRRPQRYARGARHRQDPQLCRARVKQLGRQKSYAPLTAYTEDGDLFADSAPEWRAVGHPPFTSWPPRYNPVPLDCSAPAPSRSPTADPASAWARNASVHQELRVELQTCNPTDARRTTDDDGTPYGRPDAKRTPDR